MKRCPACNRTYPDDNFAFCLEDGSLLSAPYNPQVTLVLHTPPVPNRELDSTLLELDVTPSLRGRTEELYLEFWNSFRKFCKAKGSSLRLNKQSTRFWYSIGVGRSNFAISVSASSQKRRLGCEIYLSGDNAKRAFKLLERERQAIEKSTGPLEWQELPDRRDCRIVIYRRDVDITDKSTWEDAFAWLKSKAELFYETFSHRIKALPS